jgi:hypothetical protein
MRSSSSTSFSGVMPGRHWSRLELDRGLEHLQRRRVGRGLGATGLAEHALTSGTVLIMRSVCCSSSGLAADSRAARTACTAGRLRPARHELAANVLQRPQAGQTSTRRHRQREPSGQRSTQSSSGR